MARTTDSEPSEAANEIKQTIAPRTAPVAVSSAAAIGWFRITAQKLIRAV
jgi:hypothetical protein